MGACCCTEPEANKANAPVKLHSKANNSVISSSRRIQDLSSNKLGGMDSKAMMSHRSLKSFKSETTTESMTSEAVADSRRTVRAETTEDLSNPIAASKAHKPMSRTDTKLVTEALSKTVLFRGLSQSDLIAITREMIPTDVKQGDTLIVEGEKADRLYIVTEGEVREKNTEGQTMKGKGSVIAELSLLYGLPHSTTVRAETNAKLWVMGRLAFKRVNMIIAKQRQRQYGDFLEKVPLLVTLTEEERLQIADTLVEEEFKSGQTIMERGEEGNCMYFLMVGQVAVHKPGEDGRRRTVVRYHPGDYFGERALLKRTTRAATVMATRDCKLLRLDRRVCSLLLGSVESMMKERMKKNYSEDMVNLRAFQEDPASKAAMNIKRFSMITIQKFPIRDLILVRFLGKGAFGRVKLAIDDKGTPYAVKCVNKAKAVKRKQQKNLNSERTLMLALTHPFIVKLYGTERDYENIYFILEPMPGGDLFKLLKKQPGRRFTENQARYYAASIASIWLYLHENDIVHRDLKPENVLVDYKGFPKLTDFGFAKVIEGTTYTFLGTPDYMAPEIIRSKGYGKGVDWWTLGILVYEMITGAGKTPFFSGRDRMKLYAKILDGVVHFPKHMSTAAKQLISSLLKQQPHERVGMGKHGAENIRKHPFFARINFKALIEGKIPSPKEVIPEEMKQTPMEPEEPLVRPWEEFEEYKGREGDWDKLF